MESNLTRSDAYWVLNCLPGIGPVSLNLLLERFNGDPAQVLGADRRAWSAVKGLRRPAIDSLANSRSLFDLDREKDRAARMGIAFIDRDQERYPSLLREIHDPPIGFYAIGNCDFKRTCVSIVGSRRCTLYGRGIAKEFARELARKGICVVSGLARGIDTAAHQGALEAESGETLAVLGCGLDIVYPPENIDLYREIGDRGAVISEFPFGRKADRQTFPMRNRLVSGLSRAVVVVESDEAGGSMITARFAGEQGRTVCAVPGRIDQKTSRGCNRLIRDGALLLSSVDDLLGELEYEARMPQLNISYANERDSDIEDLDSAEKRILRIFEGGEALEADRIASILEDAPSEIASRLMMLELKGYIAKRMDGCFEVVSNYR